MFFKIYFVNLKKKNLILNFFKNQINFFFFALLINDDDIHCHFTAQWGAQAFKNMLIVPPGSGIVHQVNLEYLARVVFDQDNLLYPDSVVGTDSHTTMINGLGVLGWGVGGIEAEAVMLGIHLNFKKKFKFFFLENSIFW